MRSQADLGAWLPTLAVATAGLALQSCVLVSMTGILGVAGFYRRMDGASPSTALGCALRCTLGGMGALFAALFIVAMLATHFGGWWEPSADASMPALLALLGAMAIWLASAPGPGSLLDWPWPGALGLTLPLAILALAVSGSTDSVLPQCAFAAITAVLLTWTAWRLAWGAAPVMLMNARRRP